MQYGSIGWSVGATLGYAQAAKDKRVIAFIGDGSFQVRYNAGFSSSRSKKISAISCIKNVYYACR